MNTDLIIVVASVVIVLSVWFPTFLVYRRKLIRQRIHFMDLLYKEYCDGFDKGWESYEQHMADNAHNAKMRDRKDNFPHKQ